jgi:uncharacterized coiled-coil DUF342 family protein
MMNKFTPSSMEALVPPQNSLNGEVIKKEKIDDVIDKLHYSINKMKKIAEIEEELKQLEWKHTTMPTNLEKERELIEEIKVKAKELADERRKLYKSNKTLKDKYNIIVHNIEEANEILKKFEHLRDDIKNERAYRWNISRNEERQKFEKLENEIFERALEKLESGKWIDFSSFNLLVQRGVIAQEK